MRKVILIALVILLSLFVALPVNSAPPDKADDAKLRIFVHYPKPGRPAPSPAACDPTNTNPGGYGLLSWKLGGSTTYRVNYGSCPVAKADAQRAIQASFDTWTTASGVALNEGAETSARGYKRDGQNVVVWGSVPGGAIAVTYIWSSGGVAVEVDTVMGRNLPWAYNSVNNPDTTCGNLYAYDVQDILTHEVGHWMGLEDLYGAVDHDLTMYGYGDRGELKKDTLENGDKSGIGRLY